MEYIFTLLVIELFLLMLVIIATSFDYTCPSFITLVMFILSTISYIFNYQNWNVDFRGMTLLIMATGLTLIVIVELLVKNYYSKPYKNNENHGFEVIYEETPWVKDRSIKVIILLSSVAMMLVYISEVRAIGNSLNLVNMISSIGAVKNSEYHTGTFATLCLRIGYAMSNLYVFIFCHNVIISHEKIRKNAYLLISALAGVVSSFYSGSRSMMLGIVFSFIFFFVIFSRINKGW